jgi:hypothetical protein
MDIDQRIDTLEQSLSAMERKSRAWRILALLLLVALVGGVASEGVFDNASWAADEKAANEKVTKFDVVEANHFRIVDASGNHRFSVRRSGNGTQLSVVSADGKTVVSAIALQQDLGDLIFHEAAIRLNSPERSTLQATSDGTGRVKIEGGKIVVINPAHVAKIKAIERKADFDDPNFSFSPRDRARLLELQTVLPDVLIVAQPRGGGGIAIQNPLGKPVVSIQSDKTNAGLIVVHDVDGKIVGGLPAGH